MVGPPEKAGVGGAGVTLSPPKHLEEVDRKEWWERTEIERIMGCVQTARF